MKGLVDFYFGILQIKLLWRSVSKFLREHKFSFLWINAKECSCRILWEAQVLFYKKSPNCLQSGCTILHSHQERMSRSGSPRPPRHLEQTIDTHSLDDLHGDYATWKRGKKPIPGNYTHVPIYIAFFKHQNDRNGEQITAFQGLEMGRGCVGGRWV